MMDEELEMLARQVLCSQLTQYGRRRNIEHNGSNARMLIRARAYLEEALKARADPAVADPIAVEVDLPVLRQVYRERFSSSYFDDLLRRSLVSLRAGKPTRECMELFQLAERGYGAALKKYAQ